MTTAKDIAQAKELLTRPGMRRKPGMSDEAIAAAEQRYRITFPADYRALLQEILPIGDGFYDWSSTYSLDVAAIKKALAWPIDGLLYDVRHNGFWGDDWGGVRPKDDQEQQSIALSNLLCVPKLIPIYEHRYIPCDPPTAGNPVFSVWQSDVILYGTTIWDYLQIEFNDGPWEELAAKPGYRKIPFWDDLCS
jgi:hypothetical protein